MNTWTDKRHIISTSVGVTCAILPKTNATLQKATVKNDCDKIQRGMAIELKLKETGVIVLNSKVKTFNYNKHPECQLVDLHIYKIPMHVHTHLAIMNREL